MYFKNSFVIPGYHRRAGLSQGGQKQAFGYWLVRTTKDEESNEGPTFGATERAELVALSNDPVRRRTWLLFLAQKTLPFDQAIEWASNAEQFITGSALEAPAPTTNTALQSNASGLVHARGRVRDNVFELVKSSPAGLSRAEILERLQLKGDKAGEISVSNALTAMIKKHQIVRRDRKYHVD